MAIVIPPIEDIKKLKQQPTDGEWALLNYFISHLDDSFSIYFQPFLNGSLPDLIIVHPGKGVLIIEVKDYQLSSYRIEDGKWKLRHSDAKIKSPYAQVSFYKHLLYDCIEGLAEDKVIDPRMFGIVKTAVYFHKEKSGVVKGFVQEDKSYSTYTETIGYDTVQEDRLDDLYYFKIENNDIYTNELYRKFLQFLKPSEHLLEQGQEIHYSKNQLELTKSRPGKVRIKGGAGSGKTLVLAKRAVNAHIRTGKRVLILTFNLTLKNYIHDKLSQVREKFNWSAFHIDNYHRFISTMANHYSVDTDDVESIYENENLFKNVEVEKYHAIFIDEIQDFKIEWQHIILQNFLAPNGEIVVFGDEKQNIYARSKEGRDICTVITTKWKYLNEVHRFSSKMNTLAASYYDHFLKLRYEHYPIDIQMEIDFEGEITYHYYPNYYGDLTSIHAFIFQKISNLELPYNDVVILSDDVAPLRKLDQLFHFRNHINTTRTFESEETYQALRRKYPISDHMPKAEKKRSRFLLYRDLEDVRRSKKLNFWMNQGKIKLSTIHSFKGWEGMNVILLINPYNKSKQDRIEELIYTGITRSRKRLIVVNLGNPVFDKFFKEQTHLLKEYTLHNDPLPPSTLTCDLCDTPIDHHSLCSNCIYQFHIEEEYRYL